MKRFILYIVLLLFVMYAAQAFSAERVRVAILGFENNADGLSQGKANIISDMLVQHLAGSRTIEVYERQQLVQTVGKEMEYALSGLVDISTAVEVGRLVGVQYILLGSTTEFSENHGGGWNPVSLFIGVNIIDKKSTINATINMRAIDTTTGQVKFAFSETGSSSASQTTLGGFIPLNAEGEFGPLGSKAIAAATGRLSGRIKEVLGGEYSHVATVKDKSVNINIGATGGAQINNLYLIYYDGREVIDPITKTSIGREKENVAVIKINNVSSNFSTGNVVAEGGNAALIREGDKIELISSAKGMKFVTSRSPARSEDLEKLLQGGTTDTGAQLTPPAGNPTDNRLAEIAGESGINQPATTTTITPAITPVPVSGAQQFENNSTDPDSVVKTYPLDPSESNRRRIRHTGALTFINSKKQADWQQAYVAYTELAESYNGDYLAAYRAGDAARLLKKNADAKMWYDRALEINPNYKPAIDARAKMK